MQNDVVENASDKMFLIYSPGEAKLNIGAGFWSIDKGWVLIERATVFTERGMSSYLVPRSTNEDGIWMSLSQVREMQIAQGGVENVKNPLPPKHKFQMLQDTGEYIDYCATIFSIPDGGYTEVQAVISFNRENDSCSIRIDRTNDDGKTRELNIGPMEEVDIPISWQSGLSYLTPEQRDEVEMGGALVDIENATISAHKEE